MEANQDIAKAIMIVREKGRYVERHQLRIKNGQKILRIQQLWDKLKWAKFIS